MGRRRKGTQNNRGKEKWKRKGTAKAVTGEESGGGKREEGRR